MGFFGDLLGKVREGANWVLGKAKGVGNAIVSGIGKAKGAVDLVKRGADFVRNIPVLGDIVRNTPILSNIGNAIDQLTQPCPPVITSRGFPFPAMSLE